MLNTIITSFKLKIAYIVNSLLYSIKQFPIIKHLLPDALYKSRALKIIASILGILLSIIKSLTKKMFYFALLIFLPAIILEDSANIFIHIYVCLTIIGGIMNDYISTPTRDKYYSVIIMKMNPKRFAISEYIIKGITQALAFIPFVLIFSMFAEIPLYIGLSLLLFLLEIKTISIYYNLLIFDKTKKFKAQTIYSKLEMIPVMLLLILAYTLPFINISINIPIYLIILAITTIISIISMIKIINYKNYNIFFKKTLTIENVRAGDISANNQIEIKQTKDSIEYTEIKDSNKRGFAYFHDLFVSRHNKLLLKPIKSQCIIIGIIVLIASIITILIPSVRETLNNMVMNYLPYFVFIMYSLNRGKALTTAMFMNCDHSMLTYSFYRSPKVILGVFKERLKTLISYNSLPALIIGVGLALILLISGGTDNNLNYLILIVSILSMSVFFSIHYLVMYYFLQPYNAATEVMSTTYNTVQTLTYIVCYFMIELELPTFYFGIATILFCITYSIISLIVAYFIAPKTFKLRQ